MRSVIGRDAVRHGVSGLVVSLLLGGVATCARASEEPLDAEIGALLASLKQEIVRQHPARASGRAVVANFTVEGLPWGSPLGAMLQERVGRLVETGQLFRPASGSQARGITVKQVTGITNLNDPKSLTSYYGSELAIDGSYRLEGDRIVVRLTAVDDQGRALAEARGEVPMRAVPEAVAMAEVGAGHTSQLLDSLKQLGRGSTGGPRSRSPRIDPEPGRASGRARRSATS